MSQIHLIAPSGYCINQDAAQRGVQRLLESGHQVENQTIIFYICFFFKYVGNHSGTSLEI